MILNSSVTEVGQALLRKHEAYVRRLEGAKEPAADASTRLQARADELQSRNAALEKSLNAALLNCEVTEATNKTLTNELHEANGTIARQNAYHARTVGWDTRLAAALQESEDMRQERDSERQRARAAELKTAALADRLGA